MSAPPRFPIWHPLAPPPMPPCLHRWESGPAPSARGLIKQPPQYHGRPSRGAWLAAACEWRIPSGCVGQAGRQNIPIITYSRDQRPGYIPGTKRINVLIIGLVDVGLKGKGGGYSAALAASGAAALPVEGALPLLLIAKLIAE